MRISFSGMVSLAASAIRVGRLKEADRFLQTVVKRGDSLEEFIDKRGLRDDFDKSWENERSK